MLSAQRSLYASVWARSPTKIKSAVGMEKTKEWWRHWRSECPEAAQEARDHGYNVLSATTRVSGGKAKRLFWIEPRPRDWSRKPQEKAFRCLNSRLSYDERMKGQTWVRRWDDEEEDYKCRSHVQHSRQKHFSRKMNDKKVLKKKKRSAWINKKASKKRRK